MRKKIIVAAGGTGGHVFPALAIAEEIKEQWPESEILFIGTKRGLEDRVIPMAGFKLKTITMSGVARGFSPSDILNNLLMPLKVVAGLIQSAVIFFKFQPDAVVGCGGYVTGPIVMLGALANRKTFLQEQNSRPGKTTIFLSRFASEVHLTYEEAGRFLKKSDHVRLTGNPLRKQLQKIDAATARKKMKLDANKVTLLVIGGSLGARSINLAIAGLVKELELTDMQMIWQTGKADYEAMSGHSSEAVRVADFIDDMSAAYSSANLIICRAGAMTLSEITMMGLPSILIPYPYAAENHQEFNARSLVDRDAAVMVLNRDVREKLQPVLFELLRNREKLESMGRNARSLSKPDAARDFVKSMEASLRATGN